MKILLGVIIGVTVLSFLLSENIAHGIWVPESPPELLNDSYTIFVGNITSVNALQLEKKFSYITEENGTDKNFVQNYTIHLDQYHVNVEEFLKNPQNSNKITVRQPTISAGPGYLSGSDKFNVGDHVLFYVQDMDGNNTYSPESFVIPEYCAGKDVLTQERFEMGNEFFALQNGNRIDSNFTANVPIQFVWNRDVGTLSGKNFDVLVYITKSVGTGAEIVFNKEIHVESKPCQWVASAKWEFTPQAGKYGMDIRVRENGTISHLSDSGFSVKSNVMTRDNVSPLKQFKSGTAANNIICRSDLQLLIENHESFPICVKQNSVPKLLNQDWSFPSNCKYDQYPFTAGVSGIIVIEKNASNQFSDKSYSPRNSTVVIGWNNTVSWINYDDTPSSVTSNWNIFDSGLILPGKDWQHNFECVGNYGYHSEPHPWMKGWIRVLPPSR